jgi:hypothetical protein
MSLTVKVADLATRIATEFKTVKATAAADAAALVAHDADTTNVHGIANTANLETQTGAQSKATAAETAAKAYADSLLASVGSFDPLGSASAAESAAKAYADTKIGDLVNGAPGLLDTLSELAAAINDDANFSANIATALANRVRFDAAQSLTAGQKTQALSNIGAASAADLGDAASANFVTTFEAALI